MELKCKCQNCQHIGLIDTSLEELLENVNKIICSKCRSKDITIYAGNTIIYSSKLRRHCKKCNCVIPENSVEDFCLCCSKKRELTTKHKFKRKITKYYTYKKRKIKYPLVEQRKPLYMDKSYFPANPNKYLYKSVFNESDVSLKTKSHLEGKKAPEKKYFSGAIFHKRRGKKAYIDW